MAKFDPWKWGGEGEPQNPPPPRTVTVPAPILASEPVAPETVPLAGRESEVTASGYVASVMLDPKQRTIDPNALGQGGTIDIALTTNEGHTVSIDASNGVVFMHNDTSAIPLVRVAPIPDLSNKEHVTKVEAVALELVQAVRGESVPARWLANQARGVYHANGPSDDVVFIADVTIRRGDRDYPGRIVHDRKLRRVLAEVTAVGEGEKPIATADLGPSNPSPGLVAAYQARWPDTTEDEVAVDLAMRRYDITRGQDADWHVIKAAVMYDRASAVEYPQEKQTTSKRPEPPMNLPL